MIDILEKCNFQRSCGFEQIFNHFQHFSKNTTLNWLWKLFGPLYGNSLCASKLEPIHFHFEKHNRPFVAVLYLLKNLFSLDPFSVVGPMYVPWHRLMHIFVWMSMFVYVKWIHGPKKKKKLKCLNSTLPFIIFTRYGRAIIYLFKVFFISSNFKLPIALIEHFRLLNLIWKCCLKEISYQHNNHCIKIYFYGKSVKSILKSESKRDTKKKHLQIFLFGMC